MLWVGCMRRVQRRRCYGPPAFAMIHLHYSNRLEELIAPIGDLLHEDQLRDPLEPVTIVVPGRAIEEFLKLRLAEREGVAANFRVPFLRGYLADIAQRAALNSLAPALK